VFFFKLKLWEVYTYELHLVMKYYSILMFIGRDRMELVKTFLQIASQKMDFLLENSHRKFAQEHKYDNRSRHNTVIKVTRAKTNNNKDTDKTYKKRKRSVFLWWRKASRQNWCNFMQIKTIAYDTSILSIGSKYSDCTVNITLESKLLGI